MPSTASERSALCPQNAHRPVPLLPASRAHGLSPRPSPWLPLAFLSQDRLPPRRLTNSQLLHGSGVVVLNRLSGIVQGGRRHRFRLGRERRRRIVGGMAVLAALLGLI